MGVLGDIRVKVLPAKSWWVVRKRIGKTMCHLSPVLQVHAGAIAPSLVDTLAGAENARLTSAATQRGESESGGVVPMAHKHTNESDATPYPLS